MWALLAASAGPLLCQAACQLLALRHVTTRHRGADWTANNWDRNKKGSIEVPDTESGLENLVYFTGAVLTHTMEMEMHSTWLKKSESKGEETVSIRSQTEVKMCIPAPRRRISSSIFSTGFSQWPKGICEEMQSKSYHSVKSVLLNLGDNGPLLPLFSLNNLKIGNYNRDTLTSYIYVTSVFKKHRTCSKVYL